MALGAGATPDRISYGNTIKKERDIARAHALGVTLFAVDCVEEVEKIARAAPGARVFCRILTDGVGAEWPLSRKFGCVAGRWRSTCSRTPTELGLVAYGVSFHVGSQQTDTRGLGPRAGRSRRRSSARASERGMQLAHGQSRRRLPDPLPQGRAGGGRATARRSSEALRRHFGNRIPETIIEPGRGMVGDAGVLKAEVVLVSKKSRDGQPALGLSRRRQVRRPRRDHGRGDPLPDPDAARRRRRRGPCVVAGPTCDSADVLYEKAPYDLPLSLTIGDEVLIEGTGAYTTTYCVRRLQRLRAAGVLRGVKRRPISVGRRRHHHLQRISFIRSPTTNRDSVTRIPASGMNSSVRRSNPAP